jgi:hypothetical protein
MPDHGPPVPCGKVTFQGCCDGETAKRCLFGSLVVTDCANNPSCGWNGGSYSCGMSGKADPSGVHPKACAALLDAGVPDGGTPCGDVTWQGCCDGQFLYFCAGNSLQVWDCRRGPSCGWFAKLGQYTCVTNGAADPMGMVPKDCDFGDAGPPVVSNTCGRLTWQGCCDGQTVFFCEGGTVRSEDCGAWPLCGWHSGAYSFYGCGTDGNADPSGKHPKACPAKSAAPDAALACGPVSREGCCEGNTLYYCAAGQLKSMDCGQNPSCGWQAAAGYYDCGTDGAAESTGKHPISCGYDGGPPALDAGPRDLAVVATDRSIHDSQPTKEPGDSGCGCGVAARSPGVATLLLLLLVVIIPSRRAS